MMKRQHGLSLIELMISITLGILLMTGVIQMFMSSKNVYSVQKGMSGIQETGRLALEFISRDVRMAGYYGCLKTDDASGLSALVDETAANPAGAGLTGLNMNFQTVIRGYNTTSTGADALPHGAAVDLGASFTVKPNSDVLVIHGANEPGMTIKTVNTSTQAFGYTDDGSAEGFQLGSIAVISDCQKGHIFKVTTAPVVGSFLVTLTYAAWNPANIQAPPGATEDYLQGMILPVHTYVYFVATRAGAQEPSLWQRIDEAPAQEILLGVDDLSITYSTNGGSYVKAAAVGNTNWHRIKSVNVEVLVRELGIGTNEKAQSYTFNDAVVNPAASDKVLRQVFRATYGIRPRLQ
jgi:type IV pilus assembly protein PilW